MFESPHLRIARLRRTPRRFLITEVSVKPGPAQKTSLAPSSLTRRFLSGQMLEVTEILMPTCRLLIRFQVLHVDEIDLHAFDLGRLAGCVAPVELNTGDGCEDLNPDWRQPHPDHPVFLQEQRLP